MKKHFNIYTLILSLLFAAFAITGCANLFDENETDTYCTIIFDGNGGTTSDGSTTTTSQRVPFGQKAALNKNPFTRANYAFIGWTETKDKTEADFADEATLIFTRSMTLYAVWSSTDCVVTFHNNIPGAADETVTQTFTSGVAKKLLKNSFTRDDGFIFIGWATEPNAKEYIYTDEQIIPVIKSMDFYAVWGDTNKKHSITFYEQNSDSELANDYWAENYAKPVEYYGNTGLTLPDINDFSQTKMNSIGKYFVGWYTDKACTTGNEITKIPADKYAEDLKFYAKFSTMQLYVSATGKYKETPAGEEKDTPYTTLKSALDALNAEKLDWTIYIYGTVQADSQTEIATTGKFGTLLIEGVTDSNTDILTTTSGRVISITGEGAKKVTFSKVKITGGNDDNGGGININATGTTVILGTDSIVTSNTATSKGGGVYLTQGNLKLEGGIISSNTATSVSGNGNGGGVYNEGGKFVLTSGQIIGNKAGTTSASDFASNGGGIYNANGARTEIDGNVQIGTGSQQATENDCSNYANQFGGGIYNEGTLILSGSSYSISCNYAGVKAGAIYSNSSVSPTGTITYNYAAGNPRDVYPPL